MFSGNRPPNSGTFGAHDHEEVNFDDLISEIDDGNSPPLPPPPPSPSLNVLPVSAEFRDAYPELFLLMSTQGLGEFTFRLERLGCNSTQQLLDVDESEANFLFGCESSELLRRFHLVQSTAKRRLDYSSSEDRNAVEAPPPPPPRPPEPLPPADRQAAKAAAEERRQREDALQAAVDELAREARAGLISMEEAATRMPVRLALSADSSATTQAQARGDPQSRNPSRDVELVASQPTHGQQQQYGTSSGPHMSGASHTDHWRTRAEAEYYARLELEQNGTASSRHRPGGTLHPDEDNPFAVEKMPVGLRRAFRAKLLGIVTLNMTAILLLTCVIIYVPAVRDATVGKSWAIAVGCLSFIWALFFLTVLRDRYPYNYYALGFFTLSASAFFGFLNTNFHSHANLQLLIYLDAVLVLMTFCATRTVSPAVVELFDPYFNLPPEAKRDALARAYYLEKLQDERGEGPQLVSLVASGVGSWCAVFACSLVVQLRAGANMARFSSVHFFVLCLSVWFGCDARMIERRLSADDYMIGVVSFWADIVVCFFCCICIAVGAT